ncbi:hypothetical protein A3Q56_03164 [Intoshia linei]|uniref:PHD-type domain-containing protein n=1 Tax=Intoshia linei TaxID=1819745 RepID=A0A177B467_9BILA|nr:hypothetical protein A3Q56_03164 [Intoshia linei]
MNQPKLNSKNKDLSEIMAEANNLENFNYGKKLNAPDRKFMYNTPKIKHGSNPRNSRLDKDSSEESMNDVDDDARYQQLYCICRSPYNNRFMIRCDTCKEWFHGNCVNVSPEMGHQMEINNTAWYCQSCQDRHPWVDKNVMEWKDSPTDYGFKKKICYAEGCNNSVNNKNSHYCNNACVRIYISQKLKILDQYRKKTNDKYGRDDTYKNMADEPVNMFDPVSGNILTGNSAPLRKNLILWMLAHQNYEIYISEDIKDQIKSENDNKDIVKNNVKFTSSSSIQIASRVPNSFQIKARQVFKKILKKCSESNSLMLNDEEIKNYAMCLERALFDYCGEVNSSYKSKYEAICDVFENCINQDQNLAYKLLMSEMTCSKIVEQSLYQLRSQAHKNDSINSKNSFDTTKNHGYHVYDANCNICNSNTKQVMPSMDVLKRDDFMTHIDSIGNWGVDSVSWRSSIMMESNPMFVVEAFLITKTAVQLDHYGTNFFKTFPNTIQMEKSISMNDFEKSLSNVVIDKNWVVYVYAIINENSGPYYENVFNDLFNTKKCALINNFQMPLRHMYVFSQKTKLFCNSIKKINELIDIKYPTKSVMVAVLIEPREPQNMPPQPQVSVTQVKPNTDNVETNKKKILLQQKELLQKLNERIKQEEELIKAGALINQYNNKSDKLDNTNIMIDPVTKKASLSSDILNFLNHVNQADDRPVPVAVNNSFIPENVEYQINPNFHAPQNDQFHQNMDNYHRPQIRMNVLPIEHYREPPGIQRKMQFKNPPIMRHPNPPISFRPREMHSQIDEQCNNGPTVNQEFNRHNFSSNRGYNSNFHRSNEHVHENVQIHQINSTLIDNPKFRNGSNFSFAERIINQSDANLNTPQFRSETKFDRNFKNDRKNDDEPVQYNRYNERRNDSINDDRDRHRRDSFKRTRIISPIRESHNEGRKIRGDRDKDKVKDDDKKRNKSRDKDGRSRDKDNRVEKERSRKRSIDRRDRNKSPRKHKSPKTDTDDRYKKSRFSQRKSPFKSHRGYSPIDRNINASNNQITHRSSQSFNNLDKRSFMEPRRNNDISRPRGLLPTPELLPNVQSQHFSVSKPQTFKNDFAPKDVDRRI